MAYGQCQNVVCLLRNKTDYAQLTTVENMAAGSLASVFSSLALCPTELIKCRMQTLDEMQTVQSTSPTHKPMPTNRSNPLGWRTAEIVCLSSSSSPMDVTRQIIRTEGVRGLFRGFSSTLARECPGYACFFGGYELTRSLLTSANETKAELSKGRGLLTWRRGTFVSLGFLKTWIAGGVAGMCFWVLIYPIDAVKTRTQVFECKKNFARYTMEIIKTEGQGEASH